MLTRVEFQGIVYAAKAVYRFGFVTVNGDKVINTNYQTIGPVWCVYCKSRPAKEYRVIRDLWKRPSGMRPICKHCILLGKFEDVCICGSKNAGSVTCRVMVDGKIIRHGHMVLCTKCREKYQKGEITVVWAGIPKQAYTLEVL